MVGDRFLGANGAGKTTTLRILLGLVAPTAAADPLPADLHQAIEAINAGR